MLNNEQFNIELVAQANCRKALEMSVALAEIEGVRIMELNKSGQDYLEAILIVRNQRGCAGD